MSVYLPDLKGSELMKTKTTSKRSFPYSLRPSNIHSANKKERIGENMELKFVDLNMEKLRYLEFAVR